MPIGVLYLFVNVFKWGLAGAAISYDVSGWVIALGQVAMWLVGGRKEGQDCLG